MQPLLIVSPPRPMFAALFLVMFACSAEEPSPAPTTGAGAASNPGGSGGTAGGAAGGSASPAGGTSNPVGAGSGAGGAAGAAAGGGASAGSGTGGTANDSGGGGSSGSSAGASGSTMQDYCATRSGLTFCESFEALAAGAAQAKAPWTPAINGDGEVTIDGGVAHSGSHSLKVRGSGFSSFFVLGGAALPAANARMHVRLFMRLAEAMTAGHNTFLVADTQAAPGAGNAFRLGEMHEMLMYTVSGDAHGALANQNYYNDSKPGAALAATSWSCVEVALDHQKPEIQVWLDGKEISDLHHTDWAVDNYDALRFGFEKYAGPVSDVWYDDIAVGTGPLGCD